MTVLAVVLLLLALGSRGALAAPFPGESDLVTALPGLSVTPPFKHYSGYLASNNAAHLHYWFFESQSAHPEKDPVVLWLNGGPGCSSMLGALAELGPIRLSRNGSLSLNPYAWNQKANVLFLESPVGVGFSYQQNAQAPAHQDDTTTAHLNFDALRSFFVKFPHLAENSFLIAGESYAGIYIPTLAMLALENTFPKNFHGVAIGNPLLDTTLNGNSMLHFFYYHGMIDSYSWSALVSACCKNHTSGADLRHCDMVNNADHACVTARTLISGQARSAAINHYNIYGECLHDPTHAQGHTTPIPHHGEQGDNQAMDSVSYDVIKERMFFESLKINPEEYYASGPPAHAPPCLSQDYLAQFLNQDSVKKALHISPLSWDWGPCRGNIGYVREIKSVKAQIKHMVDSGIAVLIYNGDVDSVCNFLGDQWFVEELGYKTRIAYHAYSHAGQVAGFSKFYDKRLTFMTVRGAGHMVPEDKPEAALHMFNDFVGVGGVTP